jgi:hypothetical protein
VRSAFLLCAVLVVLAACTLMRAPLHEGAPPSLSGMLASDDRLAPIVNEAEHFRLQVVLGIVRESAGGRRVLEQQTFRAGAEYFYPASAIKLFAAVAALERLAELRRTSGRDLDVDTPLIYYPLFAGEERVDFDETNLDGGAVTVRHEIRKLFLVSDNEAFNRLYELVGQDGLAASLERAGLGEARIVHRLEEPRTEEENRRYPRIALAGNGYAYVIPERSSTPLPPAQLQPGLAVGSAYLEDGERIDRPMDFSPKNRMALIDLQRGLCAVLRPEVDCGVSFELSAGDRALLAEAMRQLPRESTNPVYGEDEYPDAYVKYFLPGLRRVLAPDRISCYDKIGQAYGFTTDNAWIVDELTGRSFFLAATLYTNEDGVLNDDRYEYDSVALPFLADLAEIVARRIWSP